MRYSQNSMLEIFGHNNGELSAAQKAMDREVRPTTSPLAPSVYRVDLDPVDVPYLVDQASTEGVQRARRSICGFPAG